MDASIAVVVECLGHSLDDITEDILTEPLPRSIGDILSPQHRPNVLCALVYSLSQREHFKLIECRGELFIEPRSDWRRAPSVHTTSRFSIFASEEARSDTDARRGTGTPCGAELSGAKQS